MAFFSFKLQTLNFLTCRRGGSQAFLVSNAVFMLKKPYY